MRTLLLDRDGVLIEERDYDYAPENIRLLPGVVEGLSMLRECSFFVVSNQSGVARGLTTMDQVEAVNAALLDLLKAGGVMIEDIALCPHQPSDGCACRKPKTGMWTQLSERHGLKADECIMVGNRGSDVVFGRNIGCFTVLVQDGHPVTDLPDVIVPDLPTLARFLLCRRKLTPPVMGIAAAAMFAAEARKSGKRIVTTNGAFDLLHPGHRFLLEEAKAQGDVLIVGVNSDASVRGSKGPGRPVELQDIRARKVAAYADAVFVFDDPDPRPWLPSIRPDMHVNAETYGRDCIEAPVLREIGATLVLVPVRKELGSTSEILRTRQA